MLNAIIAINPFPYFYNQTKFDGSLISWPERCLNCVYNNCSKPTNGEIHICSNGFNYISITKDIYIAGIIVKEFSSQPPARIKALKNNRFNIISKNKLLSVVSRIEALYLVIEDIKKEIRSNEINNYINTDQFKTDLFTETIDDINRAFSTLHDYRQFVTQIIQNTNVLVESNCAGVDFEDKLSKATHQVRAIYYATRIMDEKLTTSLYLKYPERIKDQAKTSKFSLHGIVLKYVRIYQMAYDHKGVQLEVLGKSHGKILGNGHAIGVIPHTLIDNALKYSNKGSRVLVKFIEDHEYIELIVESFGPRIDRDEYVNIFRPYKRGRHAIDFTEDGAGYGLYISQQIAHSIGTEINVEQEQQATGSAYHTKFSIFLPELNEKL